MRMRMQMQIIRNLNAKNAVSVGNWLLFGRRGQHKYDLLNNYNYNWYWLYSARDRNALRSRQGSRLVESGRAHVRYAHRRGLFFRIV